MHPHLMWIIFVGKEYEFSSSGHSCGSEAYSGPDHLKAGRSKLKRSRSKSVHLVNRTGPSRT